MSYIKKVRKKIEHKFHFHLKWNLLLIRCLIAITSFAFFYSCVDDDFSLGKEYLKGNMRIINLDTCTAIIKTVSEDSIITAGLGYTYAGYVDDSIFGKTKVTSYLPFNLPVFGRQDYYRFDSANFIFKYTTDYYGDTSKLQKYSLFRLTKEFSETTDDYRYFSSQSVPMESTPLIADFYLKPFGNKKVNNLRLPDEFGKELLSKFMKEEDQDVKDDKSFASYFSGFALVPNNSNNLISSFSAKSDSDICIKLYYHYFVREKDMQNNVDKQSAVITILYNKYREFCQIEVDRTGTPLESLNSKNHEIYSGNSTSKQAYIQGLTGLSMEMEFPYLKDLNLLGKNVGILGVTLKFLPEKGTFSKEYPLPDSLSLSVLNKAGDSWGTGAMRINKDEINYGLNTDYIIDVTTFFKDQLKAFGIDQKKVKLSNKVTSLSGFLRRAVIANDIENINNRVKIEIKLIIYAD